MTHAADKTPSKTASLPDRACSFPPKQPSQLHAPVGLNQSALSAAAAAAAMEFSNSAKHGGGDAMQTADTCASSSCCASDPLCSRPSISVRPTLAGLRFLISLDQHHRENSTRDTARLQHRLIRLQLAARLVAQSDDDHDRLHDLFRNERARDFATYYERRCQGLEHAVYEQLHASLDAPLAASTLSLYAPPTSFLDGLSHGPRRVCMRFVGYLRTNPAMISAVFQRLSDEELHALLPSEDAAGPGVNVPPSPLASPGLGLGTSAGSAASGTAGGAAGAGTAVGQPASVVDLLLSGIFASPHFAGEQRLRLQLWSTVFIRLITERRGERFLLDVLDRFVRLSGWCARGALETQLMKILRRGEEIVLGDGTAHGRLSNDAAGVANFGHNVSSDYGNSAAADAFFDHACEEILGVVDQYIPPSLLTLTRAVLAELPNEQRQYATSLLIVKFFFFRFLGRAITYPEYYGMCDDYYISEEQRQGILFKTNQRLYRYATAVCSAAPGWEKVVISCRVRSLLERIIARFSTTHDADVFRPEELLGSHGTSPSQSHGDFTYPLTPAASTPHPPTGLFPCVTPTLLLQAGDLVTLCDFMSTGRLVRATSRSPPNSTGSSYPSSVRRHYSFSYTSSPAAAAISAIDSREEFFLLLTQMSSIVDELRTRLAEAPALFYIADNDHTLSLKDPQSALGDGGAPVSRSSSMRRHQRDRSDASTISSSSSMLMMDDETDDELVPSLDEDTPAELYTIGAAVFRALGAFDVHDTGASMPVDHFLKAAARAARARAEFADSVLYQNALERLHQLSPEYAADNGALLIRFMARTFDRAAERRALQQRYRNAWWAYAQDTQRRLQEAVAGRVYQFASLRLRMFYISFRGSRVYERARRGILDLARQTQVAESEQQEVQRYVEMRRIDNFVPGDDQFHLFCRDVERLKEQAMQVLWTNEMFVREATLHGPPSVRAQISRQRSTSTAALLMSRLPFGRSAPAAASADRASRAFMSLGNPSASVLAGALRDPSRRHSVAPGTAYASLLGDDFVTTTQLKLVGLIMSEFHLLFRYSETDAWFNQFVGESTDEPPVLRPAAEPVRPSSVAIQSTAVPTRIGATAPSGRSRSLTLNRTSSSVSAVGIASAPIVTAVTAIATTAASTVTLPIVHTASNDTSTPPNTYDSPPLFSTGLRRVDSVATLVPVSMTPRSPAGSVCSNLSSRSERSRSSSLDTTPSPDITPVDSGHGDGGQERFGRSTSAKPVRESVLMGNNHGDPTRRGVSLSEPTYAFASAYSALCTQLTLHPSPFRKLHTLLSLNLLVSASLSLVEAPGTDAIVNELVRVLRQVRPRYLCRDLQVIATFVPDAILAMTDAGKAFVDASVAVMSLKQEIIRRVVQRARALLDGDSELAAHRSSTDDRELQLRQYEAFRLFMIAAKEGDPVGERELAILYLTLPITPADHVCLETEVLTPGDASAYFISSAQVSSTSAAASSMAILGTSAPTTSVMPPFAAGMRGHGLYGNLGAASSSASLMLSAQIAEDRNEKFNAANVAAAMKWFGRAAEKGDVEASRYLKHHQSGGSGLLA
ncbi:hypothetical protein THASP1DRAFT_31469 [Thamnocephalis sphaerospora]|uniref:Uncharacterized protein n=1 Tax=Thamnocephalis sphaerospora TaxID=78915 RepID=A0A4V1IW89_9FUNG|nr:hypothetical protein THASP1DRAFT_31469 [Thamnocephalis sphaerospora]|eukprot:RKP06719.1 hypothetical protein THASP1DRAFT_31469 [Thamnocephalis sphaerospora]